MPERGLCTRVQSPSLRYAGSRPRPITGLRDGVFPKAASVYAGLRALLLTALRARADGAT